MSSQDLRPKWWQLNLTFPLLIVLFTVENRLKISTRGHQVVQVEIILLVYGLILLWLSTNSAALSKMDPREYHGRITVIGPPPSELADAGKDKRPMFEFPNSEIKGVLSDTFEINSVAEESLPADEDSQELEED
jgi:hypothetical protein